MGSLAILLVLILAIGGQVAISPNGRWLVTAGSSDTTGQDHTARLWELTADEPVSHELNGHSQGIQDFAFTPDGK